MSLPSPGWWRLGEAVLQFQQNVFHLTENGVFTCPLLSDSREGAKSLVEMHAIEVKGSRHLTFHPQPALFKHTRKDSLLLHEKFVATLELQRRMAIETDHTHKGPISHRLGDLAHSELGGGQGRMMGWPRESGIDDQRIII